MGVCLSSVNADVCFFPVLPLLLVNIALIGGLGIFAYTNRENARSWDKRIVSAVTVGVLGLLGGQSYLAAQKAREQQGKK
jgi:Tfp pilus assembly protein PilV